ncbi:MAG: hypothetical protein GW823_07950 [Bacteroidetes bacterium]|nr:hypothetical protein [Bacteroidota bacterium]
MFESKRFWIILTGILSFLNISLIAGFIFLFLNRPITPELPSDPVFQLGNRLNLSDDQKMLLNEEFRPSDEQRLDQLQMMKHRNDLLHYAQSDSLEKTFVDSLINEIAFMHAKMESQTFYRIRKLYQISNESQRKRLRKMMEMRSNHMVRMQNRDKNKERLNRQEPRIRKNKKNTRDNSN